MTTTNVGYWSELAEIHSRGDSYPVRQVIDGGSTLRSVERDLLGDPAGRRLFHAHCHIGLDTVSLARLGFTVTGADYSPAAVHHARRIAAEAGVQNCEFVVADSSEPAAAELAGAFDVYYASYGVLVWVPDTNVWFRAAATHLRPGGELVLVDEHPYAATFEGGVASEQPPVSAPYWQSEGPYTTRNGTSYSGDPDVIAHDVQVKWPHALGEILTGAQRSGLRITGLQEYPYSHYRSVPEMTEGTDGYHHHPRWSASVPFLFSLTLRQEAWHDGDDYRPGPAGFRGAVFTDDVATWRRGTGWTPLALTANVPLGLHPAAMSLHYGQAIFEGLKAYRQPDGGVAMFAPYRNAARFARSAARLAMPELPADDFVAACETLVCADAAQIPGGAGQSLYLRPFMLATEANLGVRASDEYLFAVIASPVDHFFSSGAAADRPVVREPPCPGDRRRHRRGKVRRQLCGQPAGQGGGGGTRLRRGAVVGRGRGRLGGGAERDELLRRPAAPGPGTRAGHPAAGGHDPARLHSGRAAHSRGGPRHPGHRTPDRARRVARPRCAAITEAFACGTAATVVPIGGFAAETGRRRLGGDGAGPVTATLGDALLAIQFGRAPDTHGWMHRVPGLTLP